MKGILSFGKDITDEEIYKQEREVLIDIIYEIFRAGDFNSALYAFLKKVCEFFFAPYGEMWTLDSKGRKLILSNVFYAREDKYKGFYKRSKELSFSPGEGVPGKCWMNLNYLIIENLQERAEFIRKELAKEFNLNSLITIPIYSENEFIGVCDKKKTELSPSLAVQIARVFETKKSIAKIQELLRLIDISDDAIIVLDEEDKVLFWNQGAEKLYGISKMDALGKNINKILSYSYEAIKGKLISKGKWIGEIEQRKSGGERILVGSFMELVKNEEEEGYKIFIRNTDITFIRRLQEQLNRAQKLESIGNLASGIAHDLNNIFTPKNIDIKIEISGELHPILGDPTSINQVLLNLCVNAKDAMPNGGVLTIKVENVYIDEDYAKWNPMSKVGDYVVITVVDTGIGIPKDVMDKIFDPYFTTKGEKGTGLGLSTVYTIVKEHEGFINVYSEEGEGTVFKVYIPAISNHKNKKEEDRKEISEKKSYVLVVEDEKHIREIVKDMLERNNLNVLLAENGKEAVKILEENKELINLAIVDYNLSDVKGDVLIGEIEAMLPELKIILMKNKQYSCR
ncbi:MAG: ATP-binding protein [Dictyoglomus turgidum]|uniref:hybrid sensor histidine kinase/response regulator n=1 Tax=Dictyoglomus turgidum TaxID=513050 RepID=UPI003C7721F8